MCLSCRHTSQLKRQDSVAEPNSLFYLHWYTILGVILTVIHTQVNYLKIHRQLMIFMIKFPLFCVQWIVAMIFVKAWIQFTASKGHNWSVCHEGIPIAIVNMLIFQASLVAIQDWEILHCSCRSRQQDLAKWKHYYSLSTSVSSHLHYVEILELKFMSSPSHHSIQELA